MIKVVIMDDEYLVIEAMKTLIDWKKYNMEIVGTASDGQNGFDLIIEKQPHIVLTDIRMPMMDGLSIIEKVKYIYPDIQFILFSGYTDFEYAQKAIILGVVDYIVKPITADKVEASLYKAMEKAGLKNEGGLRDTVWQKLIQGEQIEEEKWEKTEIAMSIDEISECLILSCSLPGWKKTVADEIKRNKPLQRFGVFYSVYPNMQIIMCLGNGKNSKDKMLDALKGILNIWKRDKEECYIGVAYGQTVQIGIPKIYIQAKEAMDYALFIGEQQMVDYQTLHTGKRLPFNMQKYENSIMKSVVQNQTDDIENQVLAFAQECKELYTSPNVMKHFILEFIYSALRIKRKNINYEDYRTNIQVSDEYECPPHIYVNQCRSYQELIKWFLDELQRIADSMVDNESESKARSQIERVKAHIHTYYQKDLTLFELAELARMTPAYFSNVFKQEVGMTYIKYLTKIRLEKAKELLEEGYKVKDVSLMVGYVNYRYFCVIFKKYTGITPQQFKIN